MQIGGYPNLELLEYKTRLILKDSNIEYGELQAEVFCQCWASTALGFGGVGGSAMSNAYTTVFSDILADVHVVFFAGEFAYIVRDPSEQFRKDLAARNMASVRDAKALY